MENKNVRSAKVIWLNDDYTKLFAAMTAYKDQHGRLPTAPNTAGNMEIISILPANRRKKPWAATIYRLNNAYEAHLKGKSINECIEAGKQKNVASQATVLPKGNLSKIDAKIELLKKQKTMALNVEKEKVKKAARKAANIKYRKTVADRNAKTMVAVAPISVAESSTQELAGLLDLKLGPLTEMITKILGNQAVSVIQTTTVAQTLPEVTVAVIRAIPPVEHPVSTGDDETRQRMYSLAELRAIIREEIESFFAPVSPTTKTPVVLNTTGEVAVKKNTAKVPYLPPPEKLVTTPTVSLKKYSIYIYGLSSVQMANIRKDIPARISIEGASTFSHSIKDKARNCDIVLVSKFTNHAIEKSLISACGAEKVKFVSGGMTMINRHINEYIIAQDKL